MVEITPQAPPELEGPSLTQAIRFFSPRQKKFLIISSAVFLIIVVLSGLGFYFWLTSFKKSRVDFNISGPQQAASGEPTTYTISYWNNTNQILQNASLVVRYPQDSVVAGGKVVQSVDLGNIGIGGGGKQEVNFAFIGPDKSIEKLEAILSYKPQNTSSTFENEAVKEVAVNGSALSIDLKMPETVLPSARTIFTIHYKNNTDKVFKDVSIEAGYPQNFNFISSDQVPAKNNNVWNLGDLNSNEEGNIVISGVLRSADNLSFNLAIGINQEGKFYKFSESSSEINLTALPLKLDISVNNEETVSANPGDFLQFKIRYGNNAGISLNDVVLKVKLDGLMYDFSSLKTGGFFNGLTNIITWNAANNSSFKSLEPNESGEVDFQINVKPRYIMRTFRDKNQLLQISATMETPSAPPSLAVKSLLITSDLALKVNTKAELKSRGYYYDSFLKNSGPIPPKVNQTTTYTIHWQITNYSNDIDNVTVKTTLPEGVKWLDKKAGAGAATLEYNERTNELAWNVGKIQAGTGILLDPYEVIFQLALMPSIVKVGQIAPILNTSNLTGADNFTGNDISIAAPEIKTDLPDDSGVGILKSRVQP
ncbi:hypothetical protein A2567_02405 [Candidatus Azambacteria bacterium RIFOXYD1_FULL_42_11]|uniref:DUF11 domain-containing protein n=4 Tax=Candidatus Azamiibacteriota TaxID=1752741 RepID=A0A0G1C9F0_9BACT|nr:MAG: hypothetical protein UV07_C0002G0030 [Candidatus Azambacteria bacterium GW2011_GWB1_42_17]KKS46243.1 MAG: hypothetical protein UV10_C0005G0012 [Candidatus Azambacteria bacterium GW2011_GWA1_42_19]KKS75576.1 MAG: hypothetical protein UV48_C0009G0009 [Candidatus Azambacteria bacterium GW2011_GWA2_42_9]KKS88817.1 MAG: hypothetical protein UV62_C0002G0065 [Parcubacteria group bacterium GW2011_GWC1_43_11]OGD43261.1 MAG: hypothetical protein A2567_02405 [Candidatus Azambacteria bacterium RIFO